MLDGGEFAGDEAEGGAGGDEAQWLTVVDADSGLGIFVVFIPAELNGNFCAVGRGEHEEGVFLPGGEEGRDGFVAGADERGDERDALGGGFGEGGLRDDRARGIGRV